MRARNGFKSDCESYHLLSSYDSSLMDRQRKSHGWRLNSGKYWRRKFCRQIEKQEVHGRSIIKGKKPFNLNIHFVVSIYSLVFIKSVERRLVAFWLGSRPWDPPASPEILVSAKFRKREHDCLFGVPFTWASSPRNLKALELSLGYPRLSIHCFQREREWNLFSRRFRKTEF